MAGTVEIPLVVILNGEEPTQLEASIVRELRRCPQFHLLGIAAQMPGSSVRKLVLQNVFPSCRFLQTAVWRPDIQVFFIDEIKQLAADKNYIILDLRDEVDWSNQVFKDAEYILRFVFGQSLSFLELFQRDHLQKVELRKYHFKQNNSWMFETLREGKFRRQLDSVTLHLNGVWSAIRPWVTSLTREDIFTSVSERVEKFQSLNWSLFRFFQSMFIHACRVLLRKTRRLFLLQKWHVALIDRPLTDLLNPEKEIDRQWLLPPKGARFIADPFPVLYKGELKLFVENFDYIRGKGVLEALSLKKNAITKSEEVLELPTHLSYPSMVEEDGRLFCIPESLGEREIAIYECVEFPSRWRKVKVLVENALFSDPTIFRHGGRWWLFATKYDAFSGGNDQLFAWSSDSLLGSYSGHRKNPIKVDVGSARNAGLPFYQGAQLYRPGQDCSKSYGGAVVIQKVLRLTHDEFVEEEVRRVMPDSKYPLGCHHLAGYGNLSMIDGRSERFSLWAVVFKLTAVWRNRKKKSLAQPKFDFLPDIETTPTKVAGPFKVQTSW